MISYINKLRDGRRKDREEGSADMVAALALTPIILGLLLAIIDVSLWLNTKAHIEAISRDGVRMAAAWGGTSKGVRLNPTGRSTAELIKGGMYNEKTKGCTVSNCTKAPAVKCYVTSPTKYVATRAGETVYCDVEYYYRSIFGGDLMGFGSITAGPISYRVTALSETGYGK